MTDQPLWITVDCACGKPTSLARPRLNAFPQNQIKLGFEYLPELVDSALDAIDLLSAELEALKASFDQLLSVLDEPLSPVESLEQLRLLRESME